MIKHYRRKNKFIYLHIFQITLDSCFKHKSKINRIIQYGIFLLIKILNILPNELFQMLAHESNNNSYYLHYYDCVHMSKWLYCMQDYSCRIAYMKYSKTVHIYSIPVKLHKSFSHWLAMIGLYLNTYKLS